MGTPEQPLQYAAFRTVAVTPQYVISIAPSARAEAKPPLPSFYTLITIRFLNFIPPIPRALTYEYQNTIVGGTQVLFLRSVRRVTSTSRDTCHVCLTDIKILTDITNNNIYYVHFSLWSIRYFFHDISGLYYKHFIQFRLVRPFLLNKS